MSHDFHGCIVIFGNGRVAGFSCEPVSFVSKVVVDAYKNFEMVKVYKPGKVAIVLQGRQAGKKVVVIKQLDDGTKERPYPHAIVAGIERYPRKVTKRMGAKKLARRSKVKPFIKVVNYSHLFPTRYSVELEGLKGVLSTETFKEPSQREDSKKQIKKLLEDRYTNGKNKWFFQPLRF
ncbi:ribosomal L27e protein family-domain-containing protein [Multifurca ochricompacta]|uniref:60S ribosomal protein L27 n=1 Tax=Multifurca ochricompacta TaxID=376703 RepID=A0AAD4M7X2_9AGAM|nr:ribosomal L27e protein family-domain-containing protein [Multifurca ochricompacta]